MDRVISTRLDESAADLIGALSRQLHISKRRVLEQAIHQYAESLHLDKGKDIFELTSGAWAREESPEELVRASRAAFAESMGRRRT